MNLYTPSHLNSVNMDLHTSEIQKTQEILENLSEAIRKLIKKFSPQLGQERVSALNAQFLQYMEKFVVYRESFVPKLADLRKTHSINNAVSSVVPSMNSLALSDSSQAEQNAAIKKVKAKLEDIMEDLDKLSTKACQVDDWSIATDHYPTAS